MQHQTVRPLTTLRRYIPGPNAIAIRAWATVYDGCARNTNKLRHAFFKAYTPFIHTAAPYHVEPLTGPEFKQVCIDASKSAGGLDHFTPEDFTYLSDAAYHWIAFMLNTIESGAEWPDDLCNGRAAYLSKDELHTDDPLAYRVLLILPVVYRRWATVRLQHMQDWTYSWQLPQMFVGVEGAGAEEG